MTKIGSFHHLSPLSVSPVKKLHIFSDDEVFDTSPTRVLDFDFSTDSDQSSFDRIWDEEFDAEEKTSVEASAAPTSSRSTESRCGPQSHRRNRQRQLKVHVLPTLEETATGLFAEADNIAQVPKHHSSPRLDGPTLNDVFTPQSPSGSPSFRLDYSPGKVAMQKSNKISFIEPEVVPASRRKRELRVTTVRPKNHFDRIREFEAQARRLVQTGREEQAIEIYRKILSYNSIEVDRIKEQMNQVDGKHPNTVGSIHTRLKEDWSNLLLSTGQTRMALATLCERMGNYKKSISNCRDAYDAFTKHAAFAGSEKTSSQEYIIESQKLLQRLKNAQASFEDRRARHAQIIALRTHAVDNADVSLLSRVEDALWEVKQIEESTLGSNHPQVADTWLLLSEIAADKNNRAKALEYAVEALNVNTEALGSSHPQTGNNILRIARLHDKNHEEDAALAFFNRALETLRPLQLSPGLLGSIYNDVAIIHLRRANIDLAISVLQEALSLYVPDVLKPLDHPPDLESVLEAVQIWRNLGECYHQKREFAEAATALSRALSIQRDVRRLLEADNQNQIGQVANDKRIPHYATDGSIAETLRRLGKMYRGSGKLTEAKFVLREAIAIQRIAVARAVQSKGGYLLPEKQDELANTLYCLAEVCVDLNELDSATRLFTDSLQLRLFSDANKQGGRTNLIHCAMCLVGMGNIHLQKQEYKEAEKVFRDSLTYCDAHGKRSMVFPSLLLNIKLTSWTSRCKVCPLTMSSV